MMKTAVQSISSMAGIDALKGVRFFEEAGFPRARLTDKAVEQLAFAVDAINNTPMGSGIAFKTLRRSMRDLRTNGGLLCDTDGSVSALRKVVTVWAAAIALVDGNEYADIYRERLRDKDNKSMLLAVQSLMRTALTETIGQGS